ncbi:response regulator [Desulfotignum balticum]|jgi:two-component system cell cycle response regulator|uniref:response regulator n=1 Tax=Desulfotignum balticum TaxID=115781 RepID=UPI00040DA76C|nr:response regulator [Desulfotignum balticum]
MMTETKNHPPNSSSTFLQVLVVDDSAAMRMAIREELEPGGYEIIEAANGLDALVSACTDRPPDLITLDVEMPGLNGWETCKKLRSPHYADRISRHRNSRIPVIFVTGQNTMSERKKGFSAGAADFITKPFAEGELLETVDRILKPVALSQGMTALVVEDNVVARQIVADILIQEGLQVIEAKDGQEGYALFSSHADDINVVITDLFMPNMNGDALSKKIRKELNRSDLPIICLTATPDQSELLNVFNAGVSDYLVKPFAKEELLARITVHLERYRLSRQLKEKINDLKISNEKIRKLSITDPLTGCYNRNYLSRQLAKEITRTQRYQTPISLVLTDIDFFKKVNDTFGHSAGDTVLVEFVNTIHRVIRKDLDWVTRYGGEEFVIVLPETAYDQACQCTERLRKKIADTPVTHDEVPISITASFGVTCLDPAQITDDFSTDRLIDTADHFLYQAKENGRNRVEGSPFKPA